MSTPPNFHALDAGSAVSPLPATAGGAIAQPSRPLIDAARRSSRDATLRWMLEGTGWRVTRPGLDFIALTLALVFALRWSGRPVPLADASFLLAFSPLVLVILAVRGSYRPRLAPSLLDDGVKMASGISIGVMVLVVVQSYLATAAIGLDVLGRLWGASLLLSGAALGLAAYAQRSARLAGITGRRTLVVGAGVVGQRIARRLLESPQYGLVPIGFLDAQPPRREDRSLPVVGGPGDLDWIAQLAGVEHVVLAFSASADSVFVPVVRRAEELGLGISVVPRLFDALNDRASYETVGGLPLLGLDVTDPRGVPFAIKHFLDRVISAVALVVLAPLLAALALCVRLSSPGPVLFRQRRVGRDGRPFDCLKFRSMAPAPEDEEFHPEAGSAPGGIEGDDRRTLIGRVLRRTSLDELPQLINVVRGEMSLVGPRPERPEYVELFRRDIERYGERHRVRAGITGWAQVHGLRGQTSIADRAEWDNYYIEHWSLWLDVKILLRTVLTVFYRAE